MTRYPLTTIVFATSLLIAPVSASFAQAPAVESPPPAPSAPPAADAQPAPEVTPALPGIAQTGAMNKRRCRHQGAGGKGGHKGKHQGKRQVLERLDRIEQRQILIETMLRQLLERSGQ